MYLLDLALRNGADEAEVYTKSSKNLSIEVKDQKIDALESSISFGYALRFIKDKRLGFSYSTIKDDGESVVKKAEEAAKCADRDEYLELPAPDPETSSGSGYDSPAVEIFDPLISSIDEKEAAEKVSLLERSAYDTDKRIKNIRRANGKFSDTEAMIVSSRGIDRHYQSTACSAQIMVMAENGRDSQMAWYFKGSRFLKEVSFEEVGRSAAQRAVQLLGARRMNAQKAHVILDHMVASDFIGIFAASFSSENVQKGKSLLSGRRGSKVISPKVNIIDSGLLPGRLGSRPFDDEGVASSEKVLIKEGVLQGYLYNTYTARKDGTVSTGNAVRNGFSGLPSVGISNLVLEAASKSNLTSPDEIFLLSDKCLFVTEAMGMHFVNRVTGEFSVGVSGLWIEKGEITFPVKEAVISGNLLSLFENIEALGDDLEFYDNIGVPSILFGPIDISA